MALTKVCGNKRLAAGSVTTTEIADLAITTAKINDGAVVTAKINDGAVVTAKIADEAVTPAKLDKTGSFTLANITVDSDTGDQNQVTISGNGNVTTKGGELNIQNAAGDTSYLKVAADGAVSTTGNASIGANLSVAGNAVVTGNLTVNGTLTSVNSTDLDITDKNVTLAKGSDAAGAVGAGLTVEMSDATDASFVYDPDAASKWKVGLVGSEVEVVDLSSTQTLSNKTVLLKNGDIEGKSNYEEALRAIDDKLNTGSSYTVVETDTSDSNFTDGDTLAVGSAIVSDSDVKVYESGMRLRSGTGNDYTVDYENGKVTFLDAPCPGANLIVEYIPA